MSKNEVQLEPAHFGLSSRDTADLIEFVPAERPGTPMGSGGAVTRRLFFDVFVNGQSLWELLGKPHDQISVFFMDVENAHCIERFLLKAESDFPNNRLALFVCPECADLGCGSISVLVEKVRDKVIWCDFGYENTYDPAVILDDYKGIGPFEFDRATYGRTLLAISKPPLAKATD